MDMYNPKFAKIDLSSSQITDFPVTQEDLRLFLGGKGLAAKIFYDAVKEKIDAYDERNMIVITVSPLTGTAAACSSRFNVSTVSPLTGLLASSNCGGNFGIFLKKAGYSGLIITGKAPSHTLIDITNGTITLKNADFIWGKTTSEAQELIGGKANGKFVIGPAGENLVRYACVISEERAAGRAGVGAVFGSKNLKALVASGSAQPDFYRKEQFVKSNRRWINALRAHPITGRQLPSYGTAALITPMHYRRLLATKNYSKGSYEDFDKISGETLAEDHLVKNKGCVSCPIQCGRVVRAFGKQVKGPEVETITLFGSNLLNNDLQTIINMNHLCDEYGLDTITLGSTLGFAMELNERGLWDSGLCFADRQKLEKTIEDIAYRRGIGELLGEGTKRLAKKFGGEDFAINVKGLELAAYEPRAAQGMGLGYATANRGGCHLNGGYMVVMEGLGMNVSGKTTRGKAAFTVFFQDLMEAVSSGGSCLFTTYAIFPSFLVNKPNSVLTRMVNAVAPFAGGIIAFANKHPGLLGVNIASLIPYPVLINQITGFKLNIGSFKKMGERAFTVERLMNIRLGLTAEGDKLPRRLTDDVQDSSDPDSKVKLAVMKAQYYRIRGWDSNGVPTDKTLKRLGLRRN